MYLQDGKLCAELLGRGCAWIDTGTMDSLIEAANFVRLVESRQGIQIASLEEIAYRNEWITKEQLAAAIKNYGKSLYGAYLANVLDRKMRYQ